MPQTRLLYSSSIVECCSHVAIRVRVAPYLACRPEESLETHPWGVDWAGASKEEHVVQPAAERATAERRNHRHPKVVIPSFEDVGAVTNHVSNETWTEVSGQVDSIACFPAPCATDAKDNASIC